MFNEGQDCVCMKIRKSLDSWAPVRSLEYQRVKGRREGFLVGVGMVGVLVVVVWLTVNLFN
jgi:hypothetical protein